jgi:uncharacterized caspase-like protein
MCTRVASLIAGLCLWIVNSALSMAAEPKRLALLIGNQSYDASVGILKNPHNDIAVVAEALKSQGFEVLPPMRDAKRAAILGAVRQLASGLKAAGTGAVGFLYYSGHGAAEKDTNINYLIPVDAREPGTVAFWDESLKLDDIMRLLDQAPAAVKFVVFDACRNELRLPTKDTSKGLVPVGEQQGYFVAYASAPGKTATDRGERSGPYAAALAKELGRQGLDHLSFFQNVKETVIASTGGVQHPWESNGLSRRVYLTGEPTMPADVAMWDTVRTTNDPASLRRYLDHFPKGLFAATAEQMIARIATESAQREAASQVDIARKALEAKQAEELRSAIDEARKAREAEAEARRLAADRAAQAAQAAREAEKGGKPASAARDETAARAQTAENERAAKEALAAAEARFKAAEAKLAALETAKTEGEMTVAALPQTELPISKGTFDGFWSGTQASNCIVKSGPWHMHVEGTTIEVRRKVGNTRGTINSDGSFKLTMPAAVDGKQITVTGKLQASTGSGTYVRVDGSCRGTFTVERQ